MEHTMSNMRLNNAVEEALGQGDGLGSDGSASGAGECSLHVIAAQSGTIGGEMRLASLRINHAEDEHYGMRHHGG